MSARPSDSAGAFLRFRKEDIEQSIPARFEEQARNHPGRLAVQTRRHALTYDSLNRFANRVARAILEVRGERGERGEREEPEEPVALLLESGAPLVAAILGALKAGKIYVPLDPSDPLARIDEMLEDSGAEMIVTDAATAAFSGRFETRGRRVLSIDGLEDAGGLSDEDVGLDLSPGRLAYVFYTSGSTGRPKGVFDCHRNVLHNVLRYTNSLRIAAGDRLTLLQAPTFSGSVSSLFGALLNGAAVFPFDLRREGWDGLAAWLDFARITIYHSVPAIFESLDAGGSSSGFPSVRVVRLEGDRASRRHVEIFRRRFGDGCVLVNGLGATETGISRQFFVDRAAPDAGAVLPVGRATEDVECTIVDESGRDVEPGEAGEICVRSRYLAVGYWRRPDATRAAFRPDPEDPAGRIFRSGDLGRMRPDGCLEYLGRKDLAPKVHGRRVEVEAIEAALLESGEIRAAVVAVRQDGGASPRIVAYIVPSKRPAPTASALRRFLARRVPAHSLPSAWVPLESLPLGRNGKVDRRALPQPGSERPDLDAPFVAPRTPREESVAAIWTEVLTVSRIGVHDDFFDLGGDSLRAMQTIARLRSRMDLDVPLRLLFDHPTVARFVSAIHEENRLIG